MFVSPLIACMTVSECVCVCVALTCFWSMQLCDFPLHLRTKQAEFIFATAVQSLTLVRSLRATASPNFIHKNNYQFQ